MVRFGPFVRGQTNAQNNFRNFQTLLGQHPDRLIVYEFNNVVRAASNDVGHLSISSHIHIHIHTPHSRLQTLDSRLHTEQLRRNFTKSSGEMPLILRKKKRLFRQNAHSV